MGDKKIIPAWYFFSVSFFLPSALFLNFLARHKYPVYKAETLLILLVFFLVAVVIAFIGRWSVFVSSFLAGNIIIYYVFLIAFTLCPPVDESYSRLIERWMMGIALILIIILVRANLRAWRWLAWGSLILCLSAIPAWWFYPDLPKIRQSGYALNASSNLAPFIYLILDEHISVGYSFDSSATAQLTRDEMRKFYRRYGFLLFSNAFSRVTKTPESISNILNFRDVEGSYGIKQYGYQRQLVHNEVFRTLADKGYQIRVYQPEYLDYCRVKGLPISYCLEYSESSIYGLKDTDLAVSDKARLILGNWASSNFVGNTTVKYFQKALRLFAGGAGRATPVLAPPFNRWVAAPYNRWNAVNVLAVMDRIKLDVRTKPDGNVFFAHLLIPHGPSILDRNGRLIRDPNKWVSSRSSQWAMPTGAEQYEAYYEQILGLYRYLNEWFSELERDGILDRATIILHGDHGSRIHYQEYGSVPVTDPEWWRKVSDGYLTLFAVKAPKIPSQETQIVKPVNLLVKQFFLEPEKMLERTGPGPDVNSGPGLNWRKKDRLEFDPSLGW